MTKLDDLIDRINELRRKENAEMTKVGQIALEIAELKAKQQKHIDRAKVLFEERKLVAIEYHTTKPRNDVLLNKITTMLGRAPTPEELAEVERYYAEKAVGGTK